ncbi:MAG TPA: phospholipase D-like domain-containing protein [Caulobacteraceae bacterium]|jgi:phosphatidylserine/phosphatidylglycerophosphate/cardiolipin synthase-like enzyme|nr:phospholipase D-like domain-containing protein [Caulobacteraceae bacterium]
MTATILQPGATCWRIEPARRATFLVDGLDYFSAVRLALANARRSVLLLGWGFDPRTRLQPDGIERGDEADGIGQVLLDLARLRPDIDIRLLIWKSALPIAASQHFFPHRARAWFADTPVHFRLDNATPLAGCHHQKVVVIDDAVAFCGGADFGVDRWDSPAHLDRDARRLDPTYSVHPPRHEVGMMVDGAAARALGDLARERWRRATGEVLAPPPAAEDDPWPAPIKPDIVDTAVAIARTEPAWAGRPLVDEWKDLTLASIARARRVIYLENQYFTSPVIAEAIAKRLGEPDGPEVVFISAERSPSWFDRLTMDRTRTLVLRRLQRADVFGRFRAYHPDTSAGRPIIIHAKLAITDDVVRIGSANLNNRSCALDTECELAIEASDPAMAGAVERLRDRLVGHYLHRTPQDVAAAVARHGGLIGAIEALNRQGRLKPIRPLKMGAFTSLIATWHLGDPIGVGDAWKPWRRKAVLHAQVQAVLRGDSG